eukprot:7153880-Prymnesium_polylepis.1
MVARPRALAGTGARPLGRTAPSKRPAAPNRAASPSPSRSGPAQWPRLQRQRERLATLRLHRCNSCC